MLEVWDSRFRHSETRTSLVLGLLGVACVVA